MKLRDEFITERETYREYISYKNFVKTTSIDSIALYLMLTQKVNNKNEVVVYYNDYVNEPLHFLAVLNELQDLGFIEVDNGDDVDLKEKYLIKVIRIKDIPKMHFAEFNDS